MEPRYSDRFWPRCLCGWLWVLCFGETLKIDPEERYRHVTKHTTNLGVKLLRWMLLQTPLATTKKELLKFFFNYSAREHFPQTLRLSQAQLEACKDGVRKLQKVENMDFWRKALGVVLTCSNQQPKWVPFRPYSRPWTSACNGIPGWDTLFFSFGLVDEDVFLKLLHFFFAYIDIYVFVLFVSDLFFLALTFWDASWVSSGGVKALLCLSLGLKVYCCSPVWSLFVGQFFFEGACLGLDL